MMAYRVTTRRSEESLLRSFFFDVLYPDLCPVKTAGLFNGILGSILEI
jgi:hypothetical protein